MKRSEVKMLVIFLDLGRPTNIVVTNPDHSKKDLSQKDHYFILFHTTIDKTDRTVAAYTGCEDHLYLPTLQINPSRKTGLIYMALASLIGIPQ